MIRYKYLKDCKAGDWVYYGAGQLVQVCKCTNGKEFCLKSGYIEFYCSQETIVYPLTLHSKVLAEGIRQYYDMMHEKDLIRGSKWVNWLSKKLDELMALPDSAEREDYQKIWNEIKEQIKILEYHKSFL